MPNEKPQSGDVVASESHVGIVYDSGLTISSSYREGWLWGFLPTTDVGKIVMNDWGFRKENEGKVVFRRYTGF